MFRLRYLKVVHNSDPLVKILFNGSITLFMKISFPPIKKSSTSVHNILLDLLSKCHVNTAGSDFDGFAAECVSSFLTFIHQHLEGSFRLCMVVFHFHNLFWEALASFGGLTCMSLKSLRCNWI